MMTDTELLDWLEKTDCVSLISDDAGHWACSGDGWQNVELEMPADIQTTFVIEKHQWRKTVREAILACIEEEKSED